MGCQEIIKSQQIFTYKVSRQLLSGMWSHGYGKLLDGHSVCTSMVAGYSILYTVQMEVHAAEFTAVTMQRCVFNSSSKSRKVIYFQITFQELLLMFQLESLLVVVKVDVKKV